MKIGLFQGSSLKFLGLSQAINRICVCTALFLDVALPQLPAKLLTLIYNFLYDRTFQLQLFVQSYLPITHPKQLFDKNDSKSCMSHLFAGLVQQNPKSVADEQLKNQNKQKQKRFHSICFLFDKRLNRTTHIENTIIKVRQSRVILKLSLHNTVLKPKLLYYRLHRETYNSNLVKLQAQQSFSLRPIVSKISHQGKIL